MNLRERKKLAAWRDIRAAALELFDEQGVEATTVEQIAAAANVSRATFFNYFAGKEAVLFDRDPEEREHWHGLMNSRPADEPLWDSLTAIILDFAESAAERIPLKRRLETRTRAMPQSREAFGEQFHADLLDWAASRTAEDDRLTATLQVNLALAAALTAYQMWDAADPFDEFLRLLRDCFDQVARTRATPSGGTT